MENLISLRKDLSAASNVRASTLAVLILVILALSLYQKMK